MPNSSPDSPSLFRSEALAAIHQNRFGNTLIHQPWGFSLVAGVVGILIILIISYAYFGTYTRKATARGLLMPEQGMLRLTASSFGVLTDVRVSEGQQVQKGDALFVISGERQSGVGGTQALISEQLDQRLNVMLRNKVLTDERLVSEVHMFDSRLATINSELRQFSEEVRLLERRAQLAQAHLSRQQELVNSGFISVAQLQQAEAELLILQGHQQSNQRARASLQRERTGLLAQRQEAELRHRSEISEVESATALIKQEQAENEVRSEQISVAPFAGTVTGLNAQIGQQVSAGSLLASLIPQGAILTAHLYVAPRQAGFIESGQKVLLRYAAYPYQKFGMARGQVTNVSKSPYAPQELQPHIATALKGQGIEADLFYRVSVALESPSIDTYGKKQMLQAGMLLDADVIQDRRRLYEWALEPLYSVTGKLHE
ncbi:HlyD family secretion protein [Pseudomonas sp. NMS19W]|uniref:HlyD family secretion protein n=1 Tax=Pseudomonas sp. NMS19W TaxID=3079768 RepID=UPI003F65F5D7